MRRAAVASGVQHPTLRNDVAHGTNDAALQSGEEEQPEPDDPAKAPMLRRVTDLESHTLGGLHTDHFEEGH
jgi:hypothetical protein